MDRADVRELNFTLSGAADTIPAARVSAGGRRRCRRWPGSSAWPTRRGGSARRRRRSTWPPAWRSRAGRLWWSTSTRNATPPAGWAWSRRPGIRWSPAGHCRTRSWRPRSPACSSSPARRASPMPTRLSAANRQRASVLRQQLSGELGRFDYVLLDCPPSLGPAHPGGTRPPRGRSSSPSSASTSRWRASRRSSSWPARPRSRDNPRLEIGGIVLTMFDPGLELAKEVAGEVRDYFADDRLRLDHPAGRRDQRGPQPRQERDGLRPPGPRRPGLYGTCHGGHRP